MSLAQSLAMLRQGNVFDPFMSANDPVNDPTVTGESQTMDAAQIHQQQADRAVSAKMNKRDPQNLIQTAIGNAFGGLPPGAEIPTDNNTPYGLEDRSGLQTDTASRPVGIAAPPPLMSDYDYARQRLQTLRNIGIGSRKEVTRKLLAEYDQNPDSAAKNLGKGALLGLRQAGDFLGSPEARNMPTSAALGRAVGATLGGALANLFIKHADESVQWKEDLGRQEALVGQMTQERQTQQELENKTQQVQNQTAYYGQQILNSNRQYALDVAKQFTTQQKEIWDRYDKLAPYTIEEGKQRDDVQLLSKEAAQLRLSIPTAKTGKPDWAVIPVNQGNSTTLLTYDKNAGPESIRDIGTFAKATGKFDTSYIDSALGILSNDEINRQAQASTAPSDTNKRLKPGASIPAELQNEDGGVDMAKLNEALSNGYYVKAGASRGDRSARVAVKEEDFYERPTDTTGQRRAGAASKIAAGQKFKIEMRDKLAAAVASGNSGTPEGTIRSANLMDAFIKIMQDKSMNDSQKRAAVNELISRVSKLVVF